MVLNKHMEATPTYHPSKTTPYITATAWPHSLNSCLNIIGSSRIEAKLQEVTQGNLQTSEFEIQLNST